MTDTQDETLTALDTATEIEVEAEIEVEVKPPAYFLTLDAAGAITGSGYTPDSTIPANAIVCTQAQAERPGDWSVVAGEIVAAPSPTLEQIRAAMPALSPRQFWLAASRINITKADVLVLVDAMEDKAAAADMRIEITETVSFQRTNDAVDQLATLLGITPEQLDSLWTWAAQF
ncbi:hypothetical protein H4S14_004175 [Agrobacterium vitis]|nr:hypothetical protein [Agrobacterium vitis]MBE1440401.1 hypothetical protein [Agrobacterium vitis]